MFRHYYKSIAKSAGKDFRDGAVVPFERVWMSSVLYLIVPFGVSPFTSHSGVKNFECDQALCTRIYHVACKQMWCLVSAPRSKVTSIMSACCLAGRRMQLQ